jgi:ubiquitin C-terminal hydrolase
MQLETKSIEGTHSTLWFVLQTKQEFLNYLLDVLHEDSNKIKNKPSVEALEDDWVKANSLPRVGEEAWRRCVQCTRYATLKSTFLYNSRLVFCTPCLSRLRFLRRNRSVMADVAMGQVLNTVTCPVCMFSSRNFDPFNILSIPFPTVADVVFVCTVIRRGTALNCPRVLNRPRKGEKKSRFERKKLRDSRSLSDNTVFEQYAIAMSRLADIGDLKLRLQNISGISAKRLKLCKLEEVVVTEDADDSSPVKTYMKVTVQPDKDGPCATVAKSGKSSDEVEATPPSPTKIIAFEMTLRSRLTSSSEDGIKGQAEIEDSRVSDDSSTTVDEEDDSTHNGSRAYTQRERRLVKEQLQLYGDKKECRLLDTDPLLLSKAISRSLWPASDREFKLGLRVDAIDHRDHWFPGSVVEIIEGVEGVGSENGEEEQSEHATKTKVLIHFDNFSSKWDETYTIDDFKRGQVRPLYSHATPRVKPTEFLVSHRYTDRSTKANVLFGQAFFLQCENEWSTARAGAHILAQASRFLHRPDLSSHGPVDVDEVNDTGMVQRVYDKVQATISDLIDLLVECDRAYVRSSLGISEDGKDLKEDTYRNPEFDAVEISNELVKKAGALLHRLPFEVRVHKEDAPLGSGKAGASSEECSFPFSLMRTIGNYMNARHAVLLHWRDPPPDKKYNARTVLNSPVMYTVPHVAVHKSTTELLHQSKAHASKNNPGSGGMDLSICLKEFCKTQKLDLSDSWRCPRCKDFREGKQHMDLWRLPDLLTFHIKRFNCSTRWREKITTKVNFPLTGLDMSEWCHPESLSTESNVYDLFGVMNHYGGMTGGHYVALCKATACGPEGSEEAAYNFPGAGTKVPSVVDETDKAGWRLGVTRKEKEINQNKVAAAAAAKYVSESSEPLWLQFDDELIEPIPPRNVVSEMAYVLFYRRRQLTSANIAKYSTLE